MCRSSEEDLISDLCSEIRSKDLKISSLKSELDSQNREHSHIRNQLKARVAKLQDKIAAFREAFEGLADD